MDLLWVLRSLSTKWDSEVTCSGWRQFRCAIQMETFCCLSLDSCWKHSLPGRFECPLLCYREWEGETTPVSVTEFSTTVSDTRAAQTKGKTSESAVRETKVNSLSHFIHRIPCRAIKPSVPVSYACVCTCAHMPAVWAVPGKRLDTGRTWPRQCPPTVGVKWVQGAKWAQTGQMCSEEGASHMEAQERPEVTPFLVHLPCASEWLSLTCVFKG